MKTIVRLLVSLVTVMLLTTAAYADFFDWLRGNVLVQGTVGYVQSNHFMLISKDNTMVRVFMQQGQMVPNGLMPGLLVNAWVYRESDQTVFLDRLESVLSPSGQMVPITQVRPNP